MLVLFGTEAQADTVSCLAGIFASKTKDVAVTGAAVVVGTGATSVAATAVGTNKVLAVPTSDIGVAASIAANTTAIGALAKANASINSTTAAQTTGFTIQRCIVEPLVTIMARSLLNKFTADTIRWINSGFKGSPLYVTNVSGFFADVADRTVGQYLDGISNGVLCSHFDLQLRLSLGLQYQQSPYYEEIGCRLTDIQQNVQRAFTGGSFGKNGWDNWLQLTAQPQNNPYGAYLNAVNAIDLKIANTQVSLKSELDWGKGFLSSRNPQTGLIETPGSLIESQLSSTLGVQVQKVGLARDIDAIMDALVNQLINQVLGPGGLLGASASRTGGGPSAVDRAIAETVAQIAAANNQSQSLPAGVLIGSQTNQQFCQQFNTSLYFSKKSADGKVEVWVKIPPGTVAVPTQKSGGVAWTVADYNAIWTFCASLPYTELLDSAYGDFQTKIDAASADYKTQIDAITTPDANTGGETVQDRKIQLGGRGIALNQSSVYSDNRGAFGPERVANGYGYSYSITLNDPPPGSWWSASFTKSEKVQTVIINTNEGISGYTLILANRPSSDNKLGIPISPQDIGVTVPKVQFSCDEATHNLPAETKSTCDDRISNFRLDFATPIDVNAIILKRSSQISLKKVELFRPPQGTAGGGASGGGGAITPAPTFTAFVPLTTTARPNSTVAKYGPSFRIFSNSFALSTNKTQDKLSAQVRLLQKNADNTYSGRTLGSTFNDFSITFGNNKVTFDANQMRPTALPPTVIFKPDFTLTENAPLQITQEATIGVGGENNRSVGFVDGSYQLVTEILNGSGAVIATQRTSFDIQQ